MKEYKLNKAKNTGMKTFQNTYSVCTVRLDTPTDALI